MKMPTQICSDATGALDHHKLWYHVACAAATAVFVKIGWQATPSDSLAFLFFVYLGCVGGVPLATQFLVSKYGGGNGNGHTGQG